MNMARSIQRTKCGIFTKTCYGTEGSRYKQDGTKGFELMRGLNHHLNLLTPLS